MIIYVDIDGVLCTNTYGEYDKAEPIQDNILKINQLYDNGHRIVIWTARGTLLSDAIQEIQKLTVSQLKQWEVKYHQLKFGKPYYDRLIDDRASDIIDLKSMDNNEAFK